MVAVLASQLQASPVTANESIPTQFVRALSSGDLRSFLPIASDRRQLRERDWIAVARAIDEFHCIDAESMAIQVMQQSADTIEYRVDLGVNGPVPHTWYLTAVLSPEGWRIAVADDDATRIARRMMQAGDERERENVLESAESSFAAVTAAMAAIPLYSAAERREAEPAIEFLLRSANERGEIGAVAPLLSAFASMKFIDQEGDTAEALARHAVAVAPTPRDREAALLALGSLLLLRDRAAGKCILEDLAGSNDPEIAHRALVEIANIDDEHYNFDLEEGASLSKACAAYAEQSGSVEVGYRAYLNLGLLHRLLHSDEASVDALEKAVRFARRHADAAREAEALLWLANERERIPVHDGLMAGETVPELRKALTIVPPQRSDIRGYLVASLGVQLHNIGHFAESRELEAEALSLAGKTDDGLVKSVLFFYLEHVRKGQKRFEEQVQFATESIRAGAPWPLWREWMTRAHLGEALWNLGRYDEALPHLERSVQLIEARKVLVPTSIDGTFRYMIDKAFPYRLYVDALIDLGRNADALKTFERFRSLLLTEAMDNRSLPSAYAEPNDSRRVLEEALARLNRTRFAETHHGENAAIEEHQRALRFEIERLQSEAILSERPSPLSEDWKHVLDGDGVLSDPGTIIVTYQWLGDDLTVFLVSRPGDSANVKISRLKVDDALLCKTISDLRSRLSSRALAYQADARVLYQILIAPIEQSLAGFSTIYFIPDGDLWHVPFHLLTDASGKMLIERAAIAYAPSIVALRTAAATAHGRRGTAGTLLAFGNPTVGHAAARQMRLRYRDIRLGDLPEAASEVRTLQSMYGSEATTFVGATAEEALAKRLAANYRILHFASHGISDGSRAMYSALLLAPSKALDGDDGVLEAREIAQMHLNADLAVLSACDTATGSIYRHQGVVGLSWAFLIAGCPTTVASQWNTESKSTEELMVAFHRHLRAGESKPQALRSSMLELRRRPGYGHPFYWAPFVVIGAP
jgi:CHAT domain-containing protein